MVTLLQKFHNINEFVFRFVTSFHCCFLSFNLETIQSFFGALLRLEIYDFHGCICICAYVHMCICENNAKLNASFVKLSSFKLCDIKRCWKAFNQFSHERKMIELKSWKCYGKGFPFVTSFVIWRFCSTTSGIKFVALICDF